MLLKNAIILTEKEDYLQIANSRMGGKPDLPLEMPYPITEHGFYEFILQVNLSEQKIEGLPQTGLLSIFFGNRLRHEAMVLYFEESETLETKEIPLHEKFAGQIEFDDHIPYKIKLCPIENKARKEQPFYNDPQFTEEENIMHWEIDFKDNHSYFLGPGIADMDYRHYLRINGFDFLANGWGIELDANKNSVRYTGQDSNMEYRNIWDVKNCKKTRFYERWEMNQKSTHELRQKWIHQLNSFEQNKEFHLERFKNFTCLLSLANHNEVNGSWSHYRKLEIYGYSSAFSNLDFTQVYSVIP